MNYENKQSVAWGRWRSMCPLGAVALLLTGCSQDRPSPPPATPPEAESTPAPVATAPAPVAELEGTAVELPQGTTLGDVLPRLPVRPVRLGSEAGAGARQAESSCAEQVPPEATLTKRLEVVLAGQPEQPGQVIEVCLFSHAVPRPAPSAQAGRRFSLLAVWPEGGRALHDFGQLGREPTALPPERQASGHDAATWATLIGTGDPAAPVLAVASARFFDGDLGQEVHTVRQSVRLTLGESGAFVPLLEHDLVTVDIEHLLQLCDGTAQGSAADRAAGKLDLACQRHAQLAEHHGQAAAARQALRRKRLTGKGGPADAPDPDPASLWLRDARKLLAKGKVDPAIEMALRVDALCGEPIEEAHAIVAEAVTLAGRNRSRSQPHESYKALCEPPADRPVPKRNKR